MVNSIKSIKLIVCCDVNYGIGKNNRLPWNIPEEMAHFRRKTIGTHNNCVIMEEIHLRVFLKSLVH